VRDEVGTRSRTCHGGWGLGLGTWGNCYYVCMYELIIVRSMVSYYVCRSCKYAIYTYLSYMYILSYNVQEYGICSFCNRCINEKFKTRR